VRADSWEAFHAEVITQIGSVPDWQFYQSRSQKMIAVAGEATGELTQFMIVGQLIYSLRVLDNPRDNRDHREDNFAARREESVKRDAVN